MLADLRLTGGVSGLELALRLRARHPVLVVPEAPQAPDVSPDSHMSHAHQVRFAIVTGETDLHHVQAVRDAGLPLLTKPLRPARLRAQLEAMLGPLPS